METNINKIKSALLADLSINYEKIDYKMKILWALHTEMTSNKIFCYFGGRDFEYIKWDSLLKCHSVYAQTNSSFYFIKLQFNENSDSNFYKCYYKTMKEAEDNLHRIMMELQNYNTSDEIKMKELCLKVEALWFSPNMPGYCESKCSFDEKITNTF